ncbi:MAG: family 78 glycoside hydrolase catalytic domain [Clostridia bacterium]|nr:family 78 glycoside hydrolase catalytic domain [Clostridia bacterium]
MSYTVEIKNNWLAKPICGSDSFLKECESISQIEGAFWIWPLFSSRGFLRRDFIVESEVLSAKAEFLCDNGFDIYFGEALLAENVDSFSADVTEHIKKGNNSVALRVFQTNDETHFTSAVCGKITIETESGEQVIVTDGNFKNFHPLFSNNDPEGWLTENLKEAYLNCNEIHPRLKRRSLYMRKEVSLCGEVEDAELCVFSRGEAEMYINGCRVGDEFFSQGINGKYNEYHTFSVTHMLKNGRNVIGAITGNTWLNSESHNVIYTHKNVLLAELTVRYKDGRTEVIGTDGSWKTAPSPITDNDLQFGERYDARLEKTGWSTADFCDDDWHFAEELPLDISRPYALRNYPPVRVTKLLPVLSETETEGGILFDFGFNSAGKYSLKLKNTKAGQQIKISVCEMLKENGEMMLLPYSPVCNSDDFYKPEGRAKAAIRNYDLYICRGDEREEYMPRFAFNGFRYIKIEGADRDQIEDIKLAVMHNDIDFGWKIESSDPFFKEFAEITERTMRGNMFNGFMDCPTREKNFWTGDIAVFSTTACYLADVETLLGRWTDGGRKLGRTAYGWGDEIYSVLLDLYRFYGDKNLLATRYGEVLDFTHSRLSKADGGLPNGNESPYNDHLNPFGKNLPADFFSSAFYCYNLASVAEIAEILGDVATAERLNSYYTSAVTRFNSKYFLPQENDYTPHLQSGLVLPLYFGLVPKGKEAAVAETLAKYIKEQGSLTTGYVATRFLMQVLCDYGQFEAALDLLKNDKFPSWRNLIADATTITEHWDGMAKSGCSKNHFALGALTGWMFEYLGGIRYRESAPGFETVVLRPVFIKEIGDFACEYNSKHGKIKTAWRVENNTAVYEFSAQTAVTLILPNGDTKQYENGVGRVEFGLN